MTFMDAILAEGKPRSSPGRGIPTSRQAITWASAPNRQSQDSLCRVSASRSLLGGEISTSMARSVVRSSGSSPARDGGES